MTSDRVSRHLAQKEKLKVLREQREETDSCPVITTMTKTVTENGNRNDVLEEFMRRQQHEIDEICTPITTSQQEVDALLSEIKSRWNKQKMDLLLGSCRGSVISSIVGPFGLGSVVAAKDKTGGNVTTIHNAKQDIYARPEDRYNPKDYVTQTANDLYIKGKIVDNSEYVKDEYSGDLIHKSHVDCDHIDSKNQFHQNGGYMLPKERKKQFGADNDNFAAIYNTVNRSMKDGDKKKWGEAVDKDIGNFNNKEIFGIDDRRLNAAIERGKKTAGKHAPSTTEKLSYYGERTAITGVAEAGKMGLQQSLGLLLTEFFSAAFDEISDAYHNGFKDSLKNQTFFEALRDRLERVATRVAARWKDAINAFKDGAISGFLSNMVTMLINLVMTTGKRIVRVIREGIFSILKALKMVLCPPEGMTSAQAADAALKLLTGGVVISLGIMAEEVVEKYVTAFFSTSAPILAPFASTVSVVLVGALTGIASAILVYGLDKLDIFGVQGDREHAAILQELDTLILETEGRVEKMYQDEMSRMDKMILQLSGA